MTNIYKVPTGSPIAKKQAAETFGESFVTVRSTGIIKSNDSLVLAENKTTDGGTDNDSISWGADRGIEFDLKNPCHAIKFTISGNCNNYSTAHLVDLDNNSEIANKDVSNTGTGTEIEFSVSLDTTTRYAITLYNGGNDFTQGLDNSASMPYQNGAAEIVQGITGTTVSGSSVSTGSNRYCIGEVTPVVKEASPAVEFDSPTEIMAWDVATFQKSEDGETVTVDVEESTDGGSTWTTIATDIARGQSISNASPDGQVRLVANIQRSNRSNNPRADAIARRWVI